MTPSGGESGFIPAGSRLYRLVRALVRFWFALSFRQIRLQRGEEVPESGALILLASHPAGFLDTLILVAAFEREVRCVMARSMARGFLRSLLARSLGLILFEDGQAGWASIATSCVEILANHGALVVFADVSGPNALEGPGFAQPAAALALQAESQSSSPLGVSLYPLHLFLPVERSQWRELRIYVDDPMVSVDYLTRSPEDFSKGAASLAAALAERCRTNPFRLQEEDLKEFLKEVEEVLRADLEENWASRKNWKQMAEGFELSGFVARWAAQLNYLNPGKLVALREDLNAFRENWRKWSLGKFEVENADAWASSSLRRAAVWFETVAGFGIALFGLANHLLVLFILATTRTLKKENRHDPQRTWLVRMAAVLSCYAVQILVCAHLLGRAAAGYYAPALPLSGAYLWRYFWLLGHRTRQAYLRLMLESRAAGVRRERQAFVRGLEAALAAHAELLKMPQ